MDVPSAEAVDAVRGAADDVILHIENLSVTFPAQRALDEVSLELRRGEVRALLGHNGSGKSTLIKAMAGVLQPDRGSGAYNVDRSPVRFGDPVAVGNAGVSFIHQDLALIPQATVLDNLRLGVGQYQASTLGRIHPRVEHERARRHLDVLGLRDVSPADIVGSLSPVRQTEVAIARAMTAGGERRVLVLDEPTAALPDEEVERLFGLLRRLKAEGTAILYVSHRMEEILEIADSATILREGKVVAEVSIPSVTKKDLVGLVFGRSDHVVSGERAQFDQTTPALQLDRVAAGELRSLSFGVSPGEVLGIAGLSGSGVHDIPRVLAGLARVTDGVVSIQGVHVPNGGLTPRALRARGLAVLLAPRSAKAFPELSLRENVTISNLAPFWRRGRLRPRRERHVVQSLLTEYQVRPRDPEARLSTLSGGNQQKIFLARWLRDAPRVLVLDEPNQGVDVAGSLDILEGIRRAARRDDVAIVICSSDMEDLELICDRVLVIRDGRVADELNGTEINRDAIISRCYA